MIAIKKLFQSISNSKFNPLKNKIVYSIIPVFAAWYMAIHYHAMYQTCDDMDMRILLEGSVGGQPSEPSEFTLYMNILYGKFLKVFYTLYQDGYWYDIFTYIFISLSLFVVTLSMCKSFENESILSKVFKLVVIALVGATPFISPQFTMTSGMLALSGVLSFYMWVSGYFIKKKSQIACAIYCFISILFSSLIRFECCMVVGFFSGVLLLPWWPYREWKRHLKKCCVVAGTLLAVMFCSLLDGYIVNATPEWGEMRKANIARVEIADKTNMWDNLLEPWKDIEDSIELLKDKEDINFSKADYKMLLAACFLGNSSINTSENLLKVVDVIEKEVQRFNSICSGFRVQDYRNVIPSFIFLTIAIFSLSIATYKKNIYCIISFIILIAGLNIEFRALPYRLWYNFAFAVIAVLLIHFKVVKVVNKNKYMVLFFLILIFLGIKSSYTIMHNQAITTKYQYKIFRNMRENIISLPKDKIYIAYYAVFEHAATPFRRNILRNIIVPSPLSSHTLYKQYFENNDIYYDTLWTDLCDRSKNIRLLYRPDVYDGGWSALKYSVSYYMKEKYGKDIVFHYQPIGNFVVAQCIALNEKESKIKKIFDEKIAPLPMSYEMKIFMKYELIKDILGDEATYQDIFDTFYILTGEFLNV